MNPPEDSCESFMKGLGFGQEFPHLAGDYIRLYGGGNAPVEAVAVITRNDLVVDILNITGSDNMINPTGSPGNWSSIWPDGVAGLAPFVP